VDELSLASYAEAFALTQIVEAPVYATVLVVAFGARLSRALGASILANLVSHPLFTFALAPAAVALMPPIPGVVVCETLVWLLEAGLLYAWLRRDLPLLLAVSLLANCCSFVVGLLVL